MAQDKEPEAGKSAPAAEKKREKRTITEIRDSKKTGEKMVYMSVPDYTSAKWAEMAGVDVTLERRLRLDRRGLVEPPGSGGNDYGARRGCCASVCFPFRRDQAPSAPTARTPSQTATAAWASRRSRSTPRARSTSPASAA